MMSKRENVISTNASTIPDYSMDNVVPTYTDNSNNYCYMGDDTFGINCEYINIDGFHSYNTTTTIPNKPDHTEQPNININIVYSFCIRSCNPLWTKDMIKERIERFERIGKVSSIDFIARKNIDKYHNKPYNMVFIHIKEWDPIQTQRINPKTGRYLFQDLIHRANSNRGLKIRAYYPTVNGKYHPYAYEYLVLRENKNPEYRQEIVNRKDTTRIINSIKHNYEKKISDLQAKLQQYEDDKDDFCFVEVTY